MRYAISIAAVLLAVALPGTVAAQQDTEGRDTDAAQQETENRDTSAAGEVRDGTGRVLFPACEGLDGEALTECLNALMLQAAEDGATVAETLETR